MPLIPRYSNPVRRQNGRQSAISLIGPYGPLVQASDVQLLASSPSTTTAVSNGANSGDVSIQKVLVIPFDGAYRFRFFVWIVAINVGNPNRAFAQISRNGTFVGTRWATDLDQISAQPFEEDIGGWTKGDNAELHIWDTAVGAGGVSEQCSGFGAWGSFAPVPPAAVGGYASYSDKQATGA